MPADGLDPALARAIADAALEQAPRLGCQHAQVRVERIRSQVVRLRDGELERRPTTSSSASGCGWCTTVPSASPPPSHSIPQMRRSWSASAAEAASLSSTAVLERVELADEPSHGEVEWTSPHRIDPTTVAAGRQGGPARGLERAAPRQPGVDHVAASVLAVAEDKHYADLSGTVRHQRRVRVHPQVEAVAIGEDGRLRDDADPGPAGRPGLGVPRGGRLGLGRRAGGDCPTCWRRSSRPPRSRPAATTWSSIRPTCGSPSTSRSATPPSSTVPSATRRPTPAPPSPRPTSSDPPLRLDLMHVTGDRTTPHGLATVAIDDEGVAAQTFDLVREGMLVGYQLDRSIAAADRDRARPTAAPSPTRRCTSPSSGWPTSRCARRPARARAPRSSSAASSDGIYIVGDKSWSIDMQRYNFQFTGQRFFRIQGGRLAGQLRDVAYQATTTEFWGALEASAGGPPTCSAAPSTAARASPARSHR